MRVVIGLMLVFISGFGIGVFMEFLVPSKRRPIDASDVICLGVLFLCSLIGIFMILYKKELLTTK